MKQNESLKNQLRELEERFMLFEPLLTGIESVLQIFSGLSEAQKARLTARGIEFESGKKKLSEVLLKDANDYLKDLRGKIREELVNIQTELERERHLLEDNIGKQRNAMNLLGLLDESDIEKSLAPLQHKLTTKLEELQRNDATIKTLSPEGLEIEEAHE